MIHSISDVHRATYFGLNTNVWAFAQIMSGVMMGRDGVVGSGAYIGQHARIGDRVRIGQGAHITDHMVIGNDVFIAPHVVFSNDRHPRSLNPDFLLEPPVVEDGVSIGVNATILPGVRLGKGCVIGAGAVVTKSVPPGETWVGNPAHPLPTKVTTE